MYLRDLIWDYPNTVSNWYDSAKPVSSILLSLALSVAIFVVITPTFLLGLTRPVDDGVWDEGVVGELTSLNPMYLTQNQVNRDLFELVYQRLIYIDGDGEPQASLAQSWSLSDNGRVYTFKLDRDAYWQDGVQVSAEDVIFTLRQAQEISDDTGENTIATPFEEIEIRKVDNLTVEFTVPDRTTSLYESLSFHIMPRHILENYENEELGLYGFSVFPIGSGPYTVSRIEPQLVELTLSPFAKVDPDIKQIRYHIYRDRKDVEVAFRNNILDAVSYLEESELGFLREYGNYTQYKSLIDHRRKILYFNNAVAPLKNRDVRIGLAHLTDKETLIGENKIDGKVAFSTIPSSSWAYNPNVDLYKYDLEAAAKSFKTAGFTKSEESGFLEDKEGKILEIDFYFLGNEKNIAIASSLKQMWESEGVSLILKPSTLETIINEVLATRNYQLIMLEIESTIDPDQYNLWHSLRTEYPDLNISGYEYDRVDIILERSRINRNQAERKADYQLFQRYLAQDAPAIFLYEPYYNYVMTNRASGFEVNDMNYPSERFKGITTWRIDNR